MTVVTLKPNNKPTKPGFYLVQRQHKASPTSAKKVVSKWLAMVVAEPYGTHEDLYLFLGEVSCFRLSTLEEDCLWSDEIMLDFGGKNE